MAGAEQTVESRALGLRRANELRARVVVGAVGSNGGHRYSLGGMCVGECHMVPDWAGWK